MWQAADKASCLPAGSCQPARRSRFPGRICLSGPGRTCRGHYRARTRPGGMKPRHELLGPAQNVWLHLHLQGDYVPHGWAALGTGRHVLGSGHSPVSPERPGHVSLSLPLGGQHGSRTNQPCFCRICSSDVGLETVSLFVSVMLKCVGHQVYPEPWLVTCLSAIGAPDLSQTHAARTHASF